MTTTTSTQTTVTLPKTVSGLIENAVKYQIMEDLEDTEAVRTRAKESTLSFNSFVAKLKADGLL